MPSCRVQITFDPFVCCEIVVEVRMNLDCSVFEAVSFTFIINEICFSCQKQEIVMVHAICPRIRINEKHSLD